MMNASDWRGCVPGVGFLQGCTGFTGWIRLFWIGFAQAMVGFCRRSVEWLLMTRFREVISPTAGGFALGFWLSFSMDTGHGPGAWRVVADAVAEGTTPINPIGDSLLRMPVATGMLMGLAVYSRNLVVKGQSPAGRMIAQKFYSAQEGLSRVLSLESRAQNLQG